MTTAEIQRTARAWRHVALQAHAAPSVHNTQPWRIQLGPRRLSLLADRQRQLLVLDPTGRQMTLSCGCALFNARIAAAAEEVPIRVTRFPHGSRSDLLAHLDLCAADDPAADAPALAAELPGLDEAIRDRHTNRRKFSDQPVPRDVLDAVLHDAAIEGAAAIEIRDEQDRTTLARLSQRADAMQYADPAYRAELRRWTTDDATRRDGVAARAVPHVDAGSRDEIPIRDFDARGTGFLPTETASTREQCLVLLGTDGDDHESWLRAGEALERMLLEITRRGLAASPLTQVVEVASERAALRSELRLTMYPHVLLRIGYAPPTPGSSRRALADVVQEPPEPFR